MKRILKPISALLIAAFFFQDLVWANPEILSGSNSSLQVPSIFQSPLTLREAEATLEVICTTFAKTFPNIGDDEFNYKFSPKVRGVEFVVDFDNNKQKKGDILSITCKIVTPKLPEPKEYRVEIDLEKREARIVPDKTPPEVPPAAPEPQNGPTPPKTPPAEPKSGSGDVYLSSFGLGSLDELPGRIVKGLRKIVGRPIVWLRSWIRTFVRLFSIPELGSHEGERVFWRQWRLSHVNIKEFEKKVQAAKERGEFLRSIVTVITEAGADIVLLENGTVIGCHNGYYFIVTNTHGVRKVKEVMLQAQDGKEIGKASVLLRCNGRPWLKNEDIAILAIKDENVKLTPIPVALEFQEGEVGALVSGYKNRISGGRLFDIEDKVVLYGSYSTSGDSGAPYLVERDGKFYVVAVNSGFSTDHGPDFTAVGACLTRQLEKSFLGALQGRGQGIFKVVSRDKAARKALEEFLQIRMKENLAETPLSEPKSGNGGPLIGPTLIAITAVPWLIEIVKLVQGRLTVLNKRIPIHLDILQDFVKKAFGDILTLMKRDHGTSSIGMPEKDMASALSYRDKTKLFEDFDNNGRLERSKPHLDISISWSPTKRSLGTFFSTSIHKRIASLILLSSVGIVLACVWQPFSDVAVAINIPSLSCSITIGNSYLRILVSFILGYYIYNLFFAVSQEMILDATIINPPKREQGDGAVKPKSESSGRFAGGLGIMPSRLIGPEKIIRGIFGMPWTGLLMSFASRRGMDRKESIEPSDREIEIMAFLASETGMHELAEKFDSGAFGTEEWLIFEEVLTSRLKSDYDNMYRRYKKIVKQLGQTRERLRSEAASSGKTELAEEISRRSALELAVLVEGFAKSFLKKLRGIDEKIEKLSEEPPPQSGPKSPGGSVLRGAECLARYFVQNESFTKEDFQKARKRMEDPSFTTTVRSELNALIRLQIIKVENDSIKPYEYVWTTTLGRAPPEKRIKLLTQITAILKEANLPAHPNNVILDQIYRDRIRPILGAPDPVVAENLFTADNHVPSDDIVKNLNEVAASLGLSIMEFVRVITADYRPNNGYRFPARDYIERIIGGKKRGSRRLLYYLSKSAEKAYEEIAPSRLKAIREICCMDAERFAYTLNAGNNINPKLIADDILKMESGETRIDYSVMKKAVRLFRAEKDGVNYKMGFPGLCKRLGVSMARFTAALMRGKRSHVKITPEYVMSTAKSISPAFGRKYSGTGRSSSSGAAVVPVMLGASSAAGTTLLGSVISYLFLATRREKILEWLALRSNKHKWYSPIFKSLLYVAKYSLLPIPKPYLAYILSGLGIFPVAMAISDDGDSNLAARTGSAALTADEEIVEEILRILQKTVPLSVSYENSVDGQLFPALDVNSKNLLLITDEKFLKYCARYLVPFLRARAEGNLLKYKSFISQDSPEVRAEIDAVTWLLIRPRAVSKTTSLNWLSRQGVFIENALRKKLSQLKKGNNGKYCLNLYFGGVSDGNEIIWTLRQINILLNERSELAYLKNNLKVGLIGGDVRTECLYAAEQGLKHSDTRSWSFEVESRFEWVDLTDMKLLQWIKDYDIDCFFLINTLFLHAVDKDRGLFAEVFGRPESVMRLEYYQIASAMDTIVKNLKPDALLFVENIKKDTPDVEPLTINEPILFSRQNLRLISAEELTSEKESNVWTGVFMKTEESAPVSGADRGTGTPRDNIAPSDTAAETTIRDGIAAMVKLNELIYLANTEHYSHMTFPSYEDPVVEYLRQKKEPENEPLDAEQITRRLKEFDSAIADALKAREAAKNEKKTRESVRTSDDLFLELTPLEFDNPLIGVGWNTYAATVKDAIECGVINTREEALSRLDMLIESALNWFEFGGRGARWDSCAKVLIAVLKHRLITDKKTLYLYINLFIKSGYRDELSDILDDAMDKGVVTEPADLRIPLKSLIELNRTGAYEKIVLEAIRLGIIKEKKDIDPYIKMTEDAHWWHTAAMLLGEFVKMRYLDIISGHLGKLRQGASDLPLFYCATVEYFRREMGLDESEVDQMYSSGERVLKQVIAIDEKTAKSEDHIDMDDFKERLLGAVAVMNAISPGVASQILDRFVFQRQYLPMVQDIFRIFAFLPSDELLVLREFYNSNGKALASSKANFNAGEFLVDIIGYFKAYKMLGLTLTDLRQALISGGNSAEKIRHNLGLEVIKCITERLDIAINADNLKAGAYNIPRQIDLAHLGLLVSVKSSWDAEANRLFGLLLKSCLEGNADGLTNPSKYSNYPLGIYGRENLDTVLRIRRHNLNVLKEAESEGLNIRAWLDPNKYVAPSTTSTVVKEDSASHILKQFGEKLDGLEKWLREDPRRGDWYKLKKSLGQWASIDQANPNTNLMKNLENLNKLGQFLQKIERENIGNVPEAVADLLSALEAVRSWQKTKTYQPGHQIWFWKRQPGKDIFAGNYAGSCTSLNRNSTATFEYVLDQGTQYLYIGQPDTAEGIKGYFRFFLALDEAGKPSLYIDSIDGVLASQYKNEMMAHLKRFALALGIHEENVLERSGNLTKKLGGAITNSYFHHSTLGYIRQEEGGRYLDTWAPKDGWEEAASPAQSSSAGPTAGGLGFAPFSRRALGPFKYLRLLFPLLNIYPDRGSGTPKSEASESKESMAEVTDPRQSISFEDRVILLKENEEYLSPAGVSYLEDVLAAIARGDGLATEELKKQFPSAKNPHMEYFKGLSKDARDISSIANRLVCLQVTKGCSHGCRHCAFGANAHNGIDVMPFNQIVNILESVKHDSGGTRLTGAKYLALHLDNEIFDYYDPIFDADIGDVIGAILRYFPDQKISLSTRGWYVGDKVAPRAAQKIVELRKKYREKINIRISMDLYDTRGNVIRYQHRMGQVLDILAEDKLSTLVIGDEENDNYTQEIIDSICASLSQEKRDNIEFNPSDYANGVVDPVSRKGRGVTLPSRFDYDVDNSQYGFSILADGSVSEHVNQGQKLYPAGKTRHAYINSNITLWDYGKPIKAILPQSIGSLPTDAAVKSFADFYPVLGENNTQVLTENRETYVTVDFVEPVEPGRVRLILHSGDPTGTGLWHNTETEHINDYGQNHRFKVAIPRGDSEYTFRVFDGKNWHWMGWNVRVSAAENGPAANTLIMPLGYEKPEWFTESDELKLKKIIESLKPVAKEIIGTLPVEDAVLHHKLYRYGMEHPRPVATVWDEADAIEKNQSFDWEKLHYWWTTIILGKSLYCNAYDIGRAPWEEEELPRLSISFRGTVLYTTKYRQIKDQIATVIKQIYGYVEKQDTQFDFLSGCIFDSLAAELGIDSVDIGDQVGIKNPRAILSISIVNKGARPKPPAGELQNAGTVRKPAADAAEPVAETFTTPIQPTQAVNVSGDGITFTTTEEKTDRTPADEHDEWLMGWYGGGEPRFASGNHDSATAAANTDEEGVPSGNVPDSADSAPTTTRARKRDRQLYRWKTREDSIIAIQREVERNRPDIMRRYEKLNVLSPSGIEALKEDIYRIGQGHFMLWGLSNIFYEKNVPWFKGSHIDALMCVFDKLNLDPLGFQLRWATPELRMQSLRYVFLKKAPKIMARYEKYAKLPPENREDERRSLSREIYKIGSFHLSSWRLTRPLNHKIAPEFNGRYGDILIAMFSDLKLNRLGFELDWSSPARALDSVRFVLEKECPELMESYRRFCKQDAAQVAPAEVEKLREAIYQIKVAHFQAWGLGYATLKNKVPFFEGKYSAALCKAFDNPVLAISDAGFKNYRKEHTVAKYRWKGDLERGRQNVLDAIGYYRTDILRRYNKFTQQRLSMTQDEIEGLKNDIYAISIGDFNLWGIQKALKQSYFGSLREGVLTAVFPELELEKLGFGLKLTTPEERMGSARYILWERIPRTMERALAEGRISKDELRSVKREVCDIGQADLRLWGLSSLLNKNVAPEFDGKYANILIAVFDDPALKLSTFDFRADYSSRESVLKSVRAVIEREDPELITAYEKLDETNQDDTIVESIRKRIYSITFSHFAVWGILDVLRPNKVPYFDGSYMQILMVLFDHPKLRLTTEGFLNQAINKTLIAIEEEYLVKHGVVVPMQFRARITGIADTLKNIEDALGKGETARAIDLYARAVNLLDVARKEAKKDKIFAETLEALYDNLSNLMADAHMKKYVEGVVQSEREDDSVAGVAEDMSPIEEEPQPSFSPIPKLRVKEPVPVSVPSEAVQTNDERQEIVSAYVRETGITNPLELLWHMINKGKLDLARYFMKKVEEAGIVRNLSDHDIKDFELAKLRLSEAGTPAPRSAEQPDLVKPENVKHRRPVGSSTNRLNMLIDDADKALRTQGYEFAIALAQEALELFRQYEAFGDDEKGRLQFLDNLDSQEEGMEPSHFSDAERVEAERILREATMAHTAMAKEEAFLDSIDSEKVPIDLEALEKLIILLQSPHSRMRMGGALMLANIAYNAREHDDNRPELQKLFKQALPLLISNLDHENATVRGNNANALGRLGRPIADPAIPKLIEMLKDRASEPIVCNSASEALHYLGISEDGLTGIAPFAPTAETASGDSAAPPSSTDLNTGRLPPSPFGLRRTGRRAGAAADAKPPAESFDSRAVIAEQVLYQFMKKYLFDDRSIFREISYIDDETNRATIANGVRTYWDDIVRAMGEEDVKKWQDIIDRNPSDKRKAALEELLASFLGRLSRFGRSMETRITTGEDHVFEDITDDLPKAILKKRSLMESRLDIIVAGPGFMQEAIEVYHIKENVLRKLDINPDEFDVHIKVYERPGEAGMREKLLSNQIFYSPDEVERAGPSFKNYFVREERGFRLKDEVHKQFEFEFIDFNSLEDMANVLRRSHTAEFIFCSGVMVYLGDDTRRAFQEFLYHMMSKNSLLYGVDVCLNNEMDGVGGREFFGDLWQVAPARDLWSGSNSRMRIAPYGTKLQFPELTSASLERDSAAPPSPTDLDSESAESGAILKGDTLGTVGNEGSLSPDPVPAKAPGATIHHYTPPLEDPKLPPEPASSATAAVSGASQAHTSLSDLIPPAIEINVDFVPPLEGNLKFLNPLSQEHYRRGDIAKAIAVEAWNIATERVAIDHFPEGVLRDAFLRGHQADLQRACLGFRQGLGEGINSQISERLKDASQEYSRDITPAQFQDEMDYYYGRAARIFDTMNPDLDSIDIYALSFITREDLVSINRLIERLNEFNMHKEAEAWRQELQNLLDRLKAFKKKSAYLFQTLPQSANRPDPETAPGTLPESGMKTAQVEDNAAIRDKSKGAQFMVPPEGRKRLGRSYSYVFEYLKPEELKDALEIGKKNNEDPDELRDLIAQEKVYALVAHDFERENKIAGILIYDMEEPHVCEIRKMLISPEYKDVRKSMIDHLTYRFPSEHLRIVLIANGDDIEWIEYLYNKGFSLVSRLPNHYGKGVDGYRMVSRYIPKRKNPVPDNTAPAASAGKLLDSIKQNLAGQANLESILNIPHYHDKWHCEGGVNATLNDHLREMCDVLNHLADNSLSPLDEYPMLKAIAINYAKTNPDDLQAAILTHDLGKGETGKQFGSNWSFRGHEEASYRILRQKAITYKGKPLSEKVILASRYHDSHWKLDYSKPGMFDELMEGMRKDFNGTNDDFVKAVEFIIVFSIIDTLGSIQKSGRRGDLMSVKQFADHFEIWVESRSSPRSAKTVRKPAPDIEAASMPRSESGMKTLQREEEEESGGKPTGKKNMTPLEDREKSAARPPAQYEQLSPVSMISVLDSDGFHYGSGDIVTNEDITALISGLKGTNTGGGFIGVGSFHNLDIALSREADSIVLVDCDQKVIEWNLKVLHLIETTNDFRDMLQRMRQLISTSAIQYFDEIISDKGCNRGYKVRIPFLWAKDENIFKRLKRLIEEGRVAVCQADLGDPQSMKVIGRFFNKIGSKVRLVYLSNVEEDHLWYPGRMKAPVTLTQSLRSAGVDEDTVIVSSASKESVDTLCRYFQEKGITSNEASFRVIKPEIPPIIGSEFFVDEYYGWEFVIRTIADLEKGYFFGLATPDDLYHYYQSLPLYKEPAVGGAAAAAVPPLVTTWAEATELLKSASTINYKTYWGNRPLMYDKFRAVRQAGFEAAIRDSMIISRKVGGDQQTSWGDPGEAMFWASMGNGPVGIVGSSPFILFEISQQTAERYKIGRWGGDTTIPVPLAEVQRAWIGSLDDVHMYDRYEAKIIEVRIPGMKVAVPDATEPVAETYTPIPTMTFSEGGVTFASNFDRNNRMPADERDKWQMGWYGGGKPHFASGIPNRANDKMPTTSSSATHNLYTGISHEVLERLKAVREETEALRQRGMELDRKYGIASNEGATNRDAFGAKAETALKGDSFPIGTENVSDVSIIIPHAETELYDIRNPRKCVQKMIETIISVMLSQNKPVEGKEVKVGERTLTLAFHKSIKGFESKKLQVLMRQLEKLKQKEGFNKILKNLEIIQSFGSQEELAAELQRRGINTSDKDNNIVFAFAPAGEKQKMSGLASRINSVFIEEGDFDASIYYYPLFEIVTLTLLKFHNGYDANTVRELLKDAMQGVGPAELNIEDIKDDASAFLIFSLLPKTQRYAPGDRVERYVLLNNLINSAA